MQIFVSAVARAKSPRLPTCFISINICMQLSSGREAYGLKSDACGATNSANSRFRILITCSRDLREIRLPHADLESAQPVHWRRRGCFVTLLSPSLTLTLGASLGFRVADVNIQSACQTKFSYSSWLYGF